MISINYRDNRPIYEQVRDSLRQLITTGAIPPGGKLPSVRELASELAINPNTIQRAYRELESEGYITSQPGRGSFAMECTEEREERRAELWKTLDAAAAELRWLGVGREELLEHIRGGDRDAED